MHPISFFSCQRFPRWGFWPPQGGVIRYLILNSWLVGWRWGQSKMADLILGILRHDIQCWQLVFGWIRLKALVAKRGLIRSNELLRELPFVYFLRLQSPRGQSCRLSCCDLFIMLYLVDTWRCDACSEGSILAWLMWLKILHDQIGIGLYVVVLLEMRSRVRLRVIQAARRCC